MEVFLFEKPGMKLTLQGFLFISSHPPDTLTPQRRSSIAASYARPIPADIVRGTGLHQGQVASSSQGRRLETNKGERANSTRKDPGMEPRTFLL